MTNNHHMRTICPICGGIKDNRAKICQSCRCRLGLARLGTGKYKDNVRDGYLCKFVPEHTKANQWGYVKNSILIWEEYHSKPFPNGMHIHHIDNDRANDSPNNLLAITPSEHIKITKPWEVHNGTRMVQMS